MTNEQDALGAHIWGRIYAEAWKDPTFKTQLETDPTAAVHDFCKRHNIQLKPGTRLIRVSERPKDLTDEQLTSVQGGQHPLYVYPDNSC